MTNLINFLNYSYHFIIVYEILSYPVEINQDVKANPYFKFTVYTLQYNLCQIYLFYVTTFFKQPVFPK